MAPSTLGNRYILVAVDHFTRWTEAKATTDKSASSIAQFIVEDIIFKHGAPAIIQSDNGTEFNNEVVQNMCQILEVTKKFSSPYRPQTNGMVEQTNKILILKLAKIATNDLSNWDQYLPQALFATNISRNSTMTYSPFEMLYGRAPMLPSLLFSQQVRDTTEAQDEELRRQVRRQVEASSLIKPLPGDIGDKVLVRVSTHTDKLQPKWIDGYFIIAKRCNSYRLSDGTSERTVHASNVRIARDDDDSSAVELVNQLSKGRPPD